VSAYEMLNKKITVHRKRSCGGSSKEGMKAEQTATKPEPLNQVTQPVL
jgi:hypothetical protein